MPGVANQAQQRMVRSAARVVRARGGVAFVVFDQWCRGAITVPVRSAVLQRLLGLEQHELAGAQASALINAGALLDHEVQPRDWQPAPPLPAEHVAAATR